MRKLLSRRAWADGSHDHMTRSLPCGLTLFLSEWTQVVYHRNPLYPGTM